MTCVWCVIVGYGIGSVPFAFLVTRRTARVDIRFAGSGNVGTANVWRVAGLGAAVVTLLLDIGKGAIPVVLARAAGADAWACVGAGVAAVVGHVYPVWLRGHGGKGVATTLGACLAWVPSVAAVAIAVFAVMVLLTRVVSIGSILAAMTIGPLSLAWGAPRPFMLGAFVTGGLVVYRHRGNMMRLVAGTERRIGAPRTGG